LLQSISKDSHDIEGAKEGRSVGFVVGEVVGPEVGDGVGKSVGNPTKTSSRPKQTMPSLFEVISDLVTQLIRAVMGWPMSLSKVTL
jgi:hypothetical protein